MTTMKPSDIDMSKLKFSDPKKLDNGGKMLFINYGEGINPYYIKTPEVEVPFDPSYFADNENSGKFNIKFSMSDTENNPEMKAFHEWASDMDVLLIKKADENSQSWFQRSKLNIDTLKELYTPMVKVSVDPETGEPNGKWPDSFAFKIVKRDGKFKDFSIYNKEKVTYDVDGVTDEPTDISRLITKGSLIKCVLKCNGVWIANGKFGCTWRAEQIRVKVPEGGLGDFAIVSDSEDDLDSDDESQTLLKKTKSVTMIDSSSEDSDNDEDKVEVKDPTPPPEDKPKKPRKVRVKKNKD